MAEPETLLHHAGQVAVEDPEDDGNVLPAVPQ